MTFGLDLTIYNWVTKYFLFHGDERHTIKNLRRRHGHIFQIMRKPLITFYRQGVVYKLYNVWDRFWVIHWEVLKYDPCKWAPNVKLNSKCRTSLLDLGHGTKRQGLLCRNFLGDATEPFFNTKSRNPYQMWTFATLNINANFRYFQTSLKPQTKTFCFMANKVSPSHCLLTKRHKLHNEASRGLKTLLTTYEVDVDNLR